MHLVLIDIYFLFCVAGTWRYGESCRRGSSQAWKHRIWCNLQHLDIRSSWSLWKPKTNLQQPGGYVQFWVCALGTVVRWNCLKSRHWQQNRIPGPWRRDETKPSTHSHWRNATSMEELATCHDIVLEQRPKVKIDSPKGMGTAAESWRPSRENITAITTHEALIIITTITTPEAFNAITATTTSEAFITTTRAPNKTEARLAFKAQRDSCLISSWNRRECAFWVKNYGQKNYGFRKINSLLRLVGFKPSSHF